MNISLELLKKLRQESGAGVSDCRGALEDAAGDYQKAKELLRQRGMEKAAKKAGKETRAGIIESYIHANSRVGVLVEILCETDFVARTDDFKNLAHEIALQVAAMNPKNVKELLESPYIRDSGKTVAALVKETIAKMGENITVSRFSRLSIGE